MVMGFSVFFISFLSLLVCMNFQRSFLLLVCTLALAACSTTAPAPKMGASAPPPRQVAALPAGNYLTPLPAGSPSNPLTITGKKAPNYQNPYPSGTHAYFAAQPDYPKTMQTWSADPLLEQLTKSNSKLIICLPQQRARVYVNGRVAMDWPISTGVDGRLTPSGVFRVLEKKEKHSSNKYGSHDDDGDFQGSSMPFWHRFTWDGVGLHSGRVVAGRRLSHGCIRSPYSAAMKFFSYSQMGMAVYVSRGVEDYAQGGRVRPIDVKYRPQPNADYSDVPAAPSSPVPSVGNQAMPLDASQPINPAQLLQS